MARLELSGLAASPGVALGCTVLVGPSGDDLLQVPIAAGAVEREVERLERALERARAEIRAVQSETEQALHRDLGAIFDAQALMLEDRSMIERIETWIREQQVSAEWAVHKVENELAAEFARIDAEHLRERADDVRDVARVLRRALAGSERHRLSEIEDDAVLVAHDLAPSDAVRLGREGIKAIALEKGGPTSHTVIIARSLHLPLVTAVERLTELAQSNVPVLVDGDRGLVVFDPDPAEMEEARARAAARPTGVPVASVPARTRDGEAVTVASNIDLPEEIDEALTSGADGVGLYRSEFLFIERSPELPSEDDQLEVFLRLVEAAAPRPAVIRTFDLGGRKLARELLESDEENPVLGLRGLRLTLARPHVFRGQVRALLRAAAAGPVRILLPMVTAAEEIDQFRAVLADASAELAAEGVAHRSDPELGIMIEVPAAATMADVLARRVDFFAIGTNDLMQYALAIDRNNEQVSYLYRPLHPAVLRMVRSVAESGRAAGIDVSLCGEMAAVPELTYLLVGLGMRSFSVAPGAIQRIKSEVRTIDSRQARALADRCVEAGSATEVEELLRRAGREVPA